MKQKLKLNTLKFVKEESVKKELSEQFPVNWDMDRIFEKSYQNYLKQSGKKEIPHFIMVKRNSYLRTVVTASCIALTCGAVGLTAFLQKSAPEFKDSSQRETMATTFHPSIAEVPETTQIHNDAGIVATNPVTSTMETVPQSEPETELFSNDGEQIPVIVISETTEPTDPTEPVQPIQTTAPHETNLLTLENDTIPPTEPLPQPTEPPTPIEPAPTNPPSAEPQEPITEPPETISLEPEPIEPPADDTPFETAPTSNHTQTEPQTPPSDSFEPVATTEPPNDSPSSSKHPNGKLIVMESEDGLRSVGYSWGENLSQQEIYQLQQEELKDFFDLQYSFMDDSYTFEMGSSYSFTSTNQETGEVIYISHAPYWETYNKNIPEYYRIELLSINSKDAYVVAMPELTNEEGVTDCLCTLIWDTGKSVGIIHGLYSDLDKMKHIAESLVVN